MSEWSDKWPKKPGFYWFYGKPSRQDTVSELYVVKVWKTSNSYAYVYDGAFMFKQEGGEGVWMKIPLPPLPKVEDTIWDDHNPLEKDRRK